jgi:hypothetical protein
MRWVHGVREQHGLVGGYVSSRAPESSSYRHDVRHQHDAPIAEYLWASFRQNGKDQRVPRSQ